MDKRLIILGSGGHAVSVKSSNTSYDFIGFIDNADAENVIGGDYELEVLFRNGIRHAFVGIGDGSIREKLYEKLKQIGYTVVNIVDPSAVVSIDLNGGEGIFVGKNAVVNANALIGKMSVINTAAIVEHDCRIGEYAHIAPNSTLLGNVTIGAHTLIGAGSVVLPGKTIGENSIIGAGSVVVNDIPSDCVAYGNPCRTVKRNAQ